VKSSSSADFADHQLARRILKTAANNFVERPWGGTRLRELKGLCPLPDQASVTGNGIGESFEISAFDDDVEAARYPGTVTDVDGSQVSLPRLLQTHGEALLGREWIGKFGPVIPLLPKFLNVRELLSVQGHPPGNTEVYVVVDAEPGATIRLGFNRDIDRIAFRRELELGIRQQRDFADLLGTDTHWTSVQHVMGAWLADRQRDAESVIPALSEIRSGKLAANEKARTMRLLDSLKRIYWLVLDSMNEIPLAPGQVIYNANPSRIVAARGGLPAAEVHALGNPERREFVMLEVRRPGPTFRAWDNVRFPIRSIDIDAALGVLSLDATEPEEFMRSRIPCGQVGHTVSVDSEFFTVEHIDLDAGGQFVLDSAAAHCLHVLAGAVDLVTDEAQVRLSRGESAFVPFGVSFYRGTALDAGVRLIRVNLP